MGLRRGGLSICSGKCGWKGVGKVLGEEVMWRGALLKVGQEDCCWELNYY